MIDFEPPRDVEVTEQVTERVIDQFVERIIVQFAQTMWACAWSDWNEENVDHPEYVNVSGCEITEVMPSVPDSCRKEAEKVFEAMDNLNNGELDFRIRNVCGRDGTDVEYLSHYLIMECLGHGVSYTDSYPAHDIRVLGYLEVDSPDGVELST